MKIKYFLHIFVVTFLSLNLVSVSRADLLSNISYADSLERYKNNIYFADIHEAYIVLTSHPTIEAYEVTIKRLENYLDIDPAQVQRTDFSEVLITILKTLEYVGSRDDMDLVREIQKWADKNELDNAVLEITVDILGILDGISEAKLLKSYQGDNKRLLGSASAIDHRIALEEVRRLHDDIQKEVKGQERVLNGLADLYLKDLIFSGNRITPEVFYLMGLPGNGKDTVAEAYIKALWNGDENAVTNHMYRINISNNYEANSYFGSPKGYVGSTDLPDFLKFLVVHSGGKYLLGVEGNRYIVEHNPEWKGKNLPGFTPPHKALLFVNEAHNIPKEIKDRHLKQAIERGIFKITNPGGSENAASVIELPVTFVFATNEGIDLLEPREKNGARIGQPLSYEKLIENYDRVAEDKEKLKQAILKNNGEINNPVIGSDAPGTSEEFLNRIPNHRLYLMKPLSPETLEEIAKLTITKVSKSLFHANGRLGSYEITVSDELVKFITSYEYIPSENTRPIKGRIESFIFNQIHQAIRMERIKALGTLQQVSVSLKKYSNGVKALVFHVVEPQSGTHYQFSRIIPETLKDRINRPLTSERIREIAGMREKMLENVFGVEHIVDSLVSAALVSESESLNFDSESRATVMAFLGMTSTGKTETAKQYVKARYGDKERPVVIDFNTIKSVDSLEAKILGSVDARKNPIASDFMKAYDRANGHIAFIFDEAANAPKELLKALYEILREKVATGFSDGKPRPMKNVTIILTGNAGEKIYRNIPTDLPSDLYERALHEVFKIFIKNEDLQRQILTETFPEALLARIGENIYHFGPLAHSGKRQIAQLKLVDGLKKLQAKSSERGWNILFKDEQSLLALFETIEREGFNHHSQGESIDKFVREAIIGKIKSRLLLEDVSSGSNVILEVTEGTTSKADADLVHDFKNIKLILENGREIDVEIPLGVKKVSLKKNEVDQVLTAYHEAGHEIVSEVFFGDKVKAKYLSIIEGVTIIGGDFVHYAGIRTGENVESMELTKSVVLRRAAVYAAGYIAQGLVTVGGRHDSGKNDDMKRSTHLIQDAILRYGLSKEWGMRGIPANISTEDYIDKALSSNEKERLNEITNHWLRQAAQLAREALIANADSLFANMSKAIATQGFVNADQIYELYKQNNVITERDGQSYIDRANIIRKQIELINSALEKHGKKLDLIYNDMNYKYEQAGEAYDYLMKLNKGILGYFSRSEWAKLSSFEQQVTAMYLTSRIRYESRDAIMCSNHDLI